MRNFGCLMLLLAAGCSNLLGIGYGPDHRAPEISIASTQKQTDSPHLGLVFRASAMEATDDTTLTVYPTPDTSLDIATTDVGFAYDALTVGIEGAVPRGRWTASIGFSFGVARFDAPTASESLAASGITNVSLSHDRLTATFNMRAQLACALGNMSLAIYAESGEVKSNGSIAYEYAPMGPCVEAETWRGDGERYGATLAYRF
jgi:hypothetical protein